MGRALRDFFEVASGRLRRTVSTDEGPLAVGGSSRLVAFIGHNGLMDVQVPPAAPRRGRGPSAAVVLACRSHAYFAPRLARAGCRPLVTTTGLMAPEAYTLDAILRGWAAGEGDDAVLARAASAYARYQRIPVRSGRRLFRN